MANNETTNGSKTMTEVKVNMIDELTGGEVTRFIDISNVTCPGGPLGEHNVIADYAKQRKLLEKWIDERANYQHDTILRLESWELI